MAGRAMPNRRSAFPAHVNAVPKNEEMKNGMYKKLEIRVNCRVVLKYCSSGIAGNAAVCFDNGNAKIGIESLVSRDPRPASLDPAPAPALR